MKHLVHNIRRSLTLRMMLLFLATAFAISVILHLTLGLALKNQFETRLMPHILQYQQFIRKEIGRPPNIARAAELAGRIPVDIYIYGPRVRWSSTGKHIDPQDIDFRRHGKRRFQHGEYNGSIILRSPAGADTVYLGFQRRPLQRNGQPILLLAILTVLLVLFLSYLGMRRLFKPIGTLRNGIRRIGDGELDHRIDIRRKDELGELADSINDMANDISAMLNAKRELLLAISHELRTPLTRSRVSVELLDDATAQARIRNDLDEMETLINELLESERLNTRHSSLNLVASNPDRIIRSLADDFFTNTAIRLNLAAGIENMQLDKNRFRLLVRNLVSNAVRYNRNDRGDVHVTTSSGDGTLELRISDHGEGVAQDQLPHLTEPFYRPDPSRQRKTGGYGLGLYLCRMIAEAHGGELGIDSEPGVGTTVTVKLPVRLASRTEAEDS